MSDEPSTAAQFAKWQTDWLAWRDIQVDAVRATLRSLEQREALLQWFDEIAQPGQRFVFANGCKSLDLTSHGWRLSVRAQNCGGMWSPIGMPHRSLCDAIAAADELEQKEKAE